MHSPTSLFFSSMNRSDHIYNETGCQFLICESCLLTATIFKRLDKSNSTIEPILELALSVQARPSPEFPYQQTRTIVIQNVLILNSKVIIEVLLCHGCL
jgi:hypothetical protein